MKNTKVVSLVERKKQSLFKEGFHALSTLLSRATLSNIAGLRFGGKRDYYGVFGWKNVPEYADYLAKYTRQDIVSRIIDAPPGATWANPPVFTNDSIQDAWTELNMKHQLWHKLQRVDRLSRLGSFSILLFGLSGSRIDQPIGTGEKTLLYVRPVSMNNISEIKVSTDPNSENFGKPESYKITTSTDVITTRTTRTTTIKSINDVIVHASRVVHVVENALEDEIFGIPIIERIFNLLDDLLKVTGGTAETYWMTANRGMQVDVDKEMDMQPGDEEALSDEIEEYQHGLRRFIRTRGVKMNNLGAESTDPTGIFDVQMSLLSGATGIPRRILMGSEAGQLASEQDKANWAERIDERRQLHAEPHILLPTAQLLQNAGILPEGDLEVKWPSAFIVSPLEKSQIASQFGRAVSNMSKQLGSTPMQITSVEEAREILGLEGDLAEEDKIDLIEDEPEESSSFDQDDNDDSASQDAAEDNDKDKGEASE